MASGRWRGRQQGAASRVEEVRRLGAKVTADYHKVDPSVSPVLVNLHDTGQLAKLEAAPCRFGGVRWWWRCPSCGVKRAYLYRSTARWACRSCLRLAYAS